MTKHGSPLKICNGLHTIEGYGLLLLKDISPLPSSTTPDTHDMRQINCLFEYLICKWPWVWPAGYDPPTIGKEPIPLHTETFPRAVAKTHTKSSRTRKGAKKEEKLTLFGLQAAGAVFVCGGSERSIDRRTLFRTQEHKWAVNHCPQNKVCDILCVF
jgi:hypothetical protein